MSPRLDPTDTTGRCQEEVNRFLLGGRIESVHCYELFWRACVQGDQEAWGAIYSIFSFLVRRWISKNTLYPSCGEPMDALVNHAFFTFSRHVTPERFSGFLTLGSLLAYLRRCASTAVSDAWRRNKRRLANEVAMVPEEGSPAGDTREAVDVVALWEWVESHLRDERERKLVDLTFRKGLPPREIVREEPETFPDVKEVHRMLANILRRLRRDRNRDEFR